MLTDTQVREFIPGPITGLHSQITGHCVRIKRKPDSYWTKDIKLELTCPELENMMLRYKMTRGTLPVIKVNMNSAGSDS